MLKDLTAILHINSPGPEMDIIPPKLPSYLQVQYADQAVDQSRVFPSEM